MQRYRSYIILLTVLIFSFKTSINSQVTNNDEFPGADGRHYKNLYVEIIGSGVTVSGNFEVMVKKGRRDGLGLRIGLGDSKILGDKVFSLPFEANYLFGKKRFVPEVGVGLTYSKITSTGWLTDEIETGDAVFTYIPLGFRLLPRKNGIMFRMNCGPLFNYNYPNPLTDTLFNLYFGLALGYSFF